MIGTIIYDHYICLLQMSVVPDSIFLQGLGVQHSNPRRSHARPGEQHHVVTPKVPSQHEVEVLTIRQGRSPPSRLLHLRILLNQNPIMARQGPELAFHDKLAVVYHEGDHHSPEVVIGKIGGLPRSGSVHQQRLFQCCKQTIARTVDLQIN